ncbi:unnamed protein product [Cuscuta epithymum]|uniref:Ubiquitin-like protease family profile domain-containing protein n=1 Tax=Cuscuta epithymum TaxID=186058 RepID=A0AAV0ETK7_9ASTE|nr:unnamed protein product [Cuscuta epithymum]
MQVDQFLHHILFYSLDHIYLAYRTLNINKGSKSSLRWTEVKCPQQSHKDECGYYVMGFMYDISLGLLEKRSIQKLFCLDPYTQEQINEIRDTWAKYFINHCV